MEPFDLGYHDQRKHLWKVPLQKNGLKMLLWQVSQPASAGKGADIHYCMTPEQRTWFLCSVSVIPANQLLLQQLNELIGT